MALWKAGGEVSIKSKVLDHGIVESKSVDIFNQKQDFIGGASENVVRRKWEGSGGASE